MISEHQLRTVIYNEWRQEHSVSAATANINNIFGGGTVSPWAVNRWFNRFVLEDTELRRQLAALTSTTVNDDELLRCVKANPEASTRECAAILGCCQRTIVTHPDNLGCCRVMVRWIPPRRQIREETATQPRPDLHSRKHLLSVWCDAKGPIYYELLPAGRTVTASVYIDKLEKWLMQFEKNI
ncbi:transposase [Oesophagostomum dentatum]|uniref:Transposase n=1 Tax=Oesophagostomum dentatum TaxID=61180 RepID=A0A0B1TKR4_OESDE|nr:transposase [Oesophagostomum dentatum]